jgi:glutamine synthetase
MYREAFGNQFTDYWLHLRRTEWERFVAAEGNVDMTNDEVTEWEHREYFELM